MTPYFTALGPPELLWGFRPEEPGWLDRADRKSPFSLLRSGKLPVITPPGGLQVELVDLDDFVESLH